MVQRAPFEQYIRLGSSSADRVATFAALKPRVLHDAERYINERLQSLDPTEVHAHSTKFVALNGDHYFTGFEVTPLAGFTSVSQVFDAMRAFFFNMEITLTETSSELMLREGDFESGDQDVALQRFVRSTSCGATIESNTVLFSRFTKGERADTSDDDGVFMDGDSAVIAVDFVNEDELCPYRSSERIRKDITAALTLRAYPKKKADSSQEEAVIVVTRSYFGRLHKSEALGIPLEFINGDYFGSDF